MKGVLLDIDGTLVLSNNAHAKSWEEAFAHFGYEAIYDDIRPLMGMGGDKLIPKLFPGLSAESDMGKQISNYRTELFINKYAPDLKSTPGSRDLVQRLLNDGLKIVIASSAKPEELEVLVEAARIKDLLDQIAGPAEAEQSKPDPDVIHDALNKIGLPSHEVVMLGDTPYDVEAAAKCGVKVIAFRSGGWQDSELAGAAAIYDDPADLLDHYESSPLKKV